jgi:hypothetical protein
MAEGLKRWQVTLFAVMVLGYILAVGTNDIRLIHIQQAERRELREVRAQLAEIKHRSWEFPHTCIENQRLDVVLWQPLGDVPDWKPGSMVRQGKRGDRHLFYCRSGVWVQDDKGQE